MPHPCDFFIMILWWCYVMSKPLCDDIASAFEMFRDSLNILPTAAVRGKIQGWMDRRCNGF